MIYGLLLAAGTSSRMGQAKQVLDWHGQPLVRHIAQQALSSVLDGLVVVVGAAAAATRAALTGLELVIVENCDYASGQASSLQAGLAALPAATEAIVVLLVDQPLITPEIINTLVVAYRAEPTVMAILPRYQGQRGNPVLLSRVLFAALQELKGDIGARELLQRYAAHIRWLDMDDPAVITDMDTPEAYQQLRRAT